MQKLQQLATESINPRTLHIDQSDTLTMVRLMNDEDKTVAYAVETVLPQIAAAVETASECLKRGGRLFYVGAGTSGRLGILDASECPPTFGTSPETVQGIIAGGEAAVFRSQEGAEDNEAAGADALAKKNLQANDIVIGIAASGRTPFVIGALKYAGQIGAATVAVACVKNSAIGEFAQTAIEPVTGAEAITGSTRLKAGTAQKMVLNMISTAIMIKLGKVMGNLMVDVQATNEKLKYRAKRIVMTAATCDEETAASALKKANGSAKTAIKNLLSQRRL